MDKPKLLVGFSGGETSAFMSQWLLRHKSKEYEIIYCFANTGQENEKTLEFVNKCDIYFGLNVVWLEAIINPIHGKGTRHKIVNFETAYRTDKKNGTDPFEKHIAKYGMPNVENKACTRELKSNTIKSYARSLGWKRKDYLTAIGIRVDEIDRINENYKEERLWYVLIDTMRMTKQKVNVYWRFMPFRLELKGYEGNCRVCYKKSLRKLLTIAKYHPEWFDWAIAIQHKFELYIPETHQHNGKIKLPIRFYRGYLSAQEIIEMSKQPFEEATDDSKVYGDTELFGYSLDSPNGCEESCEPF